MNTLEKILWLCLAISVAINVYYVVTGFDSKKVEKKEIVELETLMEKYTLNKEYDKAQVLSTLKSAIDLNKVEDLSEVCQRYSLDGYYHIPPLIENVKLNRDSSGNVISAYGSSNN